jgi:methylated-DNA-protein-cysteine methyltransferase-like protein
MSNDFLVKEKKIISTIRGIPRGNVASYGQVATIAGIPRGHRLVARALRNNPGSSDLPWYRVIRADGRSGMAKDSKGYLQQLSLLKEEGVLAQNGKVDMKRYQWQPDLDLLLFRPQDL